MKHKLNDSQTLPVLFLRIFLPDISLYYENRNTEDQKQNNDGRYKNKF